MKPVQCPHCGSYWHIEWTAKLMDCLACNYYWIHSDRLVDALRKF